MLLFIWKEFILWKCMVVIIPYHFTDAAFVHLHGMHTLNITYWNEESITDAAFVHLTGINTIDISGCNQHTKTDAAVVHLKVSILFVQLKGIHTLHILQTDTLDDLTLFTNDRVCILEWLLGIDSCLRVLLDLEEQQQPTCPWWPKS